MSNLLVRRRICNPGVNQAIGVCDTRWIFQGTKPIHKLQVTKNRHASELFGKGCIRNSSGKVHSRLQSWEEEGLQNDDGKLLDMIFLNNLLISVCRTLRDP